MFIPRLIVCLLVALSPFFASASSTVPQEKMTVRFATDVNYYPFEYLDEQKQIQGFDIDLARAVCAAVNLTCTFQHQRFDSLLLSLQFGRFDAVIAALDITSERKEKVDFTDSYFSNTPLFVSKKLPIGTFSTAGKFIGVKANSSNQEYLVKYEKENSFIIAYVTYAEAFSALANGRIDAVFVDQVAASEFLKQADNSLYFTTQQIPEAQQALFSEGFAIAVKKGNSLLRQRLNLGLKIITENGTYQTIYERYF